MRMGHSGYESDLWLIYITLIVSSSLYYGPIGLAVLHDALDGPLRLRLARLLLERLATSAPQLPMRLVFFVLTGFVAHLALGRAAQAPPEPRAEDAQTLTMLAQIVEARDTDAGVHLQHIQHYSRALALRMGLDERRRTRSPTPA